MTTIEFGGGPTIEERRAFAGLKEGSHIPGYGGFCPQFKYQAGNTFGNETHLLNKGKTRQSVEYIHGPSVDKDQLPLASGYNKYFADMISGYSGYIPSMQEKFGGTFPEMCNECISQLITSQNLIRSKRLNIDISMRDYQKTNPVTDDLEVQKHMSKFMEKVKKKHTLSSKREGLEPYIPGYSGFVPRFNCTNVGMGNCFNIGCRNSLDLFERERNIRLAAANQSITFDSSVSCEVKENKEENLPKSIKLSEGLIPKYSGHVPQERFTFGKTYGDVTRDLLQMRASELAAT